jgi:hypothetical protein
MDDETQVSRGHVHVNGEEEHVSAPEALGSRGPADGSAVVPGPPPDPTVTRNRWAAIAATKIRLSSRK